jgi:hypothetical protein
MLVPIIDGTKGRQDRYARAALPPGLLPAPDGPSNSRPRKSAQSGAPLQFGHNLGHGAGGRISDAYRGSPSGFPPSGLSGSRKTSSARNLRAVCTSVASQPRRRSGGACQVPESALLRGCRLFCVTTVSIVCTIKAPVPVRAVDGLDSPYLHCSHGEPVAICDPPEHFVGWDVRSRCACRRRIVPPSEDVGHGH